MTRAISFLDTPRAAYRSNSSSRSVSLEIRERSALGKRLRAGVNGTPEESQSDNLVCSVQTVTTLLGQWAECAGMSSPGMVLPVHIANEIKVPSTLPAFKPILTAVSL